MHIREVQNISNGVCVGVNVDVRTCACMHLNFENYMSVVYVYHRWPELEMQTPHKQAYTV